MENDGCGLLKLVIDCTVTGNKDGAAECFPENLELYKGDYKTTKGLSDI